MSAISFYTGRVSHQRLGAIRHGLNYNIAYVLADLDRMVAGNACSWLLGVGQRGLMSVRARDHGDGETNDLAEWVRNYLQMNNVQKPADRIDLLTLPRMFGYVFNPVSVYFISEENTGLHHVLYEVNNTFGERHFYLCATENSAGRDRHSCDKEFYVSPFLDVKGHYKFTLQPPNKSLALTIEYFDDSNRPAMTAHLIATKKRVTNWSAVSILAQFPLMTFGVFAAIQWEALKLLIKGARVRPHVRRNENLGDNVSADCDAQLNSINNQKDAA